MLQNNHAEVERRLKTFCFGSSRSQDFLEVKIPEIIDPSYGMYVWPSAPVLGQYLWFHRSRVKGKRVLELGSGTSLPGVIAAKLGAEVVLTDAEFSTDCLENGLRSCQVNEVKDVRIIPLTWGQYSPEMTKLRPDILLGSDCFYDTKDFENILITVAYFMEKNPKLEFWTTYQERSSDRTIEPLLSKWGLVCKFIPLKSFLASSSSVGGSDLPGNHTIQMLLIHKKT